MYWDPLHFEINFFLGKNATVLFKRSAKTFLAETFRRIRTLFRSLGQQTLVCAVFCGIFAEFRTVARTVYCVSTCFEVSYPKDQENHCMWTGLHTKLRVSLISGALVVFWVSQPSPLTYPPFSPLSPCFSLFFTVFLSFLPFFLLPFSLFFSFSTISNIFSFFPCFFYPKSFFPSPFHRFLVKATRLFVTSLPALCRTRHLPHTGC